MTKIIKCVKIRLYKSTFLIIRGFIMIELNSVVQTLLKSMEETMALCNLSAVYPEGVKKSEAPFVTEGDKHIITLSSNSGAVKIELEGGKLYLLCSSQKASTAQESDYKQLLVSLLEFEDESFETKDVKYTANEICESVEKFFGKAKKVTVGKDAKTAVKKGGKNSTVTYEPENLAVRFSNIYPELKEVLEANSEKYEMTLSEEFFNEHANKLIMESIKNGEQQKIKKMFNVFNMFYEEGPKDTQSLIAVSILGMNLKDDEKLLERVEGYMEKDLKSAVTGVIKHFSTLSGKKALKLIENPKPYVSKRMMKK